MPGPKAVFDADECQALLDLFERMFIDIGTAPINLMSSMEEVRAFEKLKKAGKFYNLKLKKR